MSQQHQNFADAQVEFYSASHESLVEDSSGLQAALQVNKLAQILVNPETTTLEIAAAIFGAGLSFQNARNKLVSADDAAWMLELSVLALKEYGPIEFMKGVQFLRQWCTDQDADIASCLVEVGFYLTAGFVAKTVVEQAKQAEQAAEFPSFPLEEIEKMVSKMFVLLKRVRDTQTNAEAYINVTEFGTNQLVASGNTVGRLLVACGVAVEGMVHDDESGAKINEVSNKLKAFSRQQIVEGFDAAKALIGGNIPVDTYLQMGFLAHTITVANGVSEGDRAVAIMTGMMDYRLAQMGLDAEVVIV